MPVKNPSLLVLMRHARSVMQDAKRGNTFFESEEERAGVKDMPDHLIPLAPNGPGQASATGAYLREKFGPPDVAIHSGYVRTRATLEEIVGIYPPEQRDKILVRQDLDIRERESGHTAHMLKSESERHFPWLQDYWKITGPFFARPPGGESIADVVNRARTFLQRLSDEHTGQKVFVVCHGHSKRAIRHIIEDWSPERWVSEPVPKNCGLTIYEADSSGRLILKEANLVCWK